MRDDIFLINYDRCLKLTSWVFKVCCKEMNVIFLNTKRYCILVRLLNQHL